eukprot:5939121-Prymnesium_polylepis.1
MVATGTNDDRGPFPRPPPLRRRKGLRNARLLVCLVVLCARPTPALPARLQFFGVATLSCSTLSGSQPVSTVASDVASGDVKLETAAGDTGGSDGAGEHDAGQLAGVDQKGANSTQGGLGEGEALPY